MTLTIDISEKAQANLAAAARIRGVAVNDLIEDWADHILSASDSDATQHAFDGHSVLEVNQDAIGTISARRAPQFGFAKEVFEGIDVDALLAVDVSGEFEGYL